MCCGQRTEVKTNIELWKVFQVYGGHVPLLFVNRSRSPQNNIELIEPYKTNSFRLPLRNENVFPKYRVLCVVGIN